MNAAKHTMTANPFSQSPRYWQVVFELPAAAVGMAEDAFGDIAVAVSHTETDKAKHIWTFELLFGAPPEMDEINRRLMVISAIHEVPMPVARIVDIEPQDWLANVARDFPPLSIARFYVYGSHVSEAPPAGSIPIQVDAGAAFGSGEHATTSGCLKAMDVLAKKRRFRNVLDMGCGSGILGIAAAKLWKCPVLAVDIDAVAVRVTQDNIRTNAVQTYAEAAVSDGYASECVARRASYDLILSNILARPLVAFAPALAKHLAPGGVAILSGLLTSQEKMVLSPHKALGLKLSKRFVYDHWCTLVLER